MKDSTAIIPKRNIKLKDTGIVTYPGFPVMPGEVCNLGYLIDLTRGNKISINTIVDVFFKETRIELSNLNNAVKEKNFTAISALTHKIKSAFWIMGISVLNPVFKEMEQLSSNPAHIKKMAKLNRLVNIVFIKARNEMKIKKSDELL